MVTIGAYGLQRRILVRSLLNEAHGHQGAEHEMSKGAEEVAKELTSKLRRLVRGRPTIRSRPELFQHWTTATPEGGDPTIMARHVHRSRALVKLVSDIDRDARVLEIGCNVGRNLDHLREAGFRQLEGVEINPNAVALLRTTYPHLKDCVVNVGPAEDVLPKLENEAYGLVFTMAVIEHLHPDSVEVFDHMARICNDVLLAIEPLGNSSLRQFPHDVPALFTGRGLTLVGDTPLSSFSGIAGDRSFEKFHAWRFRKGPA